jgi:hypothetical protein
MKVNHYTNESVLAFLREWAADFKADVKCLGSCETCIASGRFLKADCEYHADMLVEDEG